MSAPAAVAAASTRTRRGLGIATAALGLGVSGDLLLRVMPWGLSVTLCTLALLAAGALLIRRERIAVTTETWWLALTILLLGIAFARRDSRVLALFDVVGLILALALAAASLRGVPVRLMDAMAHVTTVVTAAFWSVLGTPLLVFRDIAWHELRAHERRPRLRAAILGVVIALPLLVIFGALFAGADPVFGGFVSNLFAIDLPSLVSHVFLIGFWAAVTGGYLRHALLETRPASVIEAAAGRPGGPVLGIVPVATALGLIDVLFLVFVVVQLRYFFGGAAVVEQTTGLTYAEYARGGFFELVTASALVLPVLLGADWLIRGARAPERRVFRQLAGLLLGLLAVVVASALQRMRLYVSAFGLTEIRLYATAFMGYLVLLFGWFAWTVLRMGEGEWGRSRFAFGGWVQGFAVLGGLHLLNPDAFIVRWNLAHPGSERSFDVRYAAEALSADAVPTLLDALPGLPAELRRDAARQLLNRWSGSEHDWRSWNWGRARARAAVAARRARLLAETQ